MVEYGIMVYRELYIKLWKKPVVEADERSFWKLEMYE